MKVFLDSDVVISSILSQTGAASFLIQKTKIKAYISNFSKAEIEAVVKRKSLDSNKLKELIQNNIETIKISESISEVKNAYKHYVTDINDSHIVAGAIKSSSKFLITYNIKHFDIEKIKNDFNILVMTPGKFLQYLRSQN